MFASLLVGAPIMVTVGIMGTSCILASLYSLDSADLYDMSILARSSGNVVFFVSVAVLH
jgi:hypothetical protein